MIETGVWSKSSSHNPAVDAKYDGPEYEVGNGYAGDYRR